MKAYKGMDENMKCHGGFQYEPGGEYETDTAKACERWFHACEYPLDVFGYYPPAGSRFFEVEQTGDLNRGSEDTKVASTKIKIGAEIGIPGLVKAAIEYTVKRSTKEEGASVTGDQGAASATGYRGAASATGDQGAASATGYRGAASATGYQGAASVTGDQGAASATGYQGAASATGYRGAASATGDQGAASATGYRGAASATGDRGAASATGYRGAASVTGDQGAASATGYRGAASATGYRGAASVTGDQGAASATGYRGAASASGDGGIAVASGYGGKVKGAIGCAIVCCERGDWNGHTYPLLAVVSAIVDGDKIKSDTWYTVRNGEFVEIEADE